MWISFGLKGNANILLPERKDLLQLLFDSFSRICTHDEDILHLFPQHVARIADIFCRLYSKTFKPDQMMAAVLNAASVRKDADLVCPQLTPRFLCPL